MLFEILRKFMYFQFPACDIGTEIVENNTCKSKYHMYLVTLGKRNIGPRVTSQSKNILKVFEFITPTLIHLTLLSFFPECPNGLGPNPTFDACVGKAH